MRLNSFKLHRWQICCHLCNLNQSSMREYTDMHLIKHVINCYEILSLSSNDGKWVVAVGTDLTTPTPKVVEVPARPVEPKTPEKLTVVWHKNYVIERVSFFTTYTTDSRYWSSSSWVATNWWAHKKCRITLIYFDDFFSFRSILQAS